VQSSSLFIERDSGLHDLHPLTKLALLGLCLVLAFALPGIVWVLAAFGLLLLPLAAWGRILAPFSRNAFNVVLPFLLSLALIQGFFAGGETELFAIGRFAFTQEGLLAGLTVAARLLLALGGTLLLMLSTRPDHLMLALTERGLPQALGYIVLTALQIFPRFQDRARVILEAQQARGLETEVGLVGRLRLLVPLIGPLILASIVDVEERAMALEARAFSRRGPKTSLITLRDSRGQALLRAGFLLAALALVAWRLLPLVRA
jgi:energy-coupling factor transport system permease protein